MASMEDTLVNVRKRIVDNALVRPSLRGRVSDSGRLSLPAEVRREVGLEKGGPVRIDLVDGSIRIRTMSEVKDRIRGLARDSGLSGKASVAGFLAWRADERSTEAKAVKD